jgi:hypothetical protein
MRTGYRGLLIDGDELATSVARRVFKDLAFSETTVWTKFLTLDNLADIEVFFHGRDLGVLSVDVDGNDYWFLERLIRLRPWIVVVEYNASFGTACISVPYDPAFRRHEKHSTGWYHGASMKALTLLCSKAGYSLVDVSEDGINVFFMRNDVKPDDVATLDADAAFRENALRNVWSGSRVADQWARIEHLPYRKLDPTPP